MLFVLGLFQASAFQQVIFMLKWIEINLTGVRVATFSPDELFSRTGKVFLPVLLRRGGETGESGECFAESREILDCFLLLLSSLLSSPS